MPDLPALLTELESREKQINDKLSRILESNPDPFPFDKTNKARKLLELIKKAKAKIHADDLDGLRGTLTKLKEEGLKIKNDLE